MARMKLKTIIVSSDLHSAGLASLENAFSFASLGHQYCEIQRNWFRQSSKMEVIVYYTLRCHFANRRQLDITFPVYVFGLKEQACQCCKQ
jgi:hypothetical protein